MAARFQPDDVDAIIRAAEIAPIPPDTVRELLDDHRELLAEWAEVEELIGHVMPLWRELRHVFNELAARIER
jgi:hypothetical protein